MDSFTASCVSFSSFCPSLTQSSSDEKQKVSKKKRKKGESLSPPKAKAARHRSVSSSSAHRYDPKTSREHHKKVSIIRLKCGGDFAEMC